MTPQPLARLDFMWGSALGRRQRQPHVLRHTTLTELVRGKKHDLALVAAFAAHSRVATTPYVQPNQQDLQTLRTHSWRTEHHGEQVPTAQGHSHIPLGTAVPSGRWHAALAGRGPAQGAAPGPGTHRTGGGLQPRLSGQGLRLQGEEASRVPEPCPRCGMKLWPRALPHPLRFHDLRHTTATLLLKAGVPLTTVQRILRHSDPALTTEVYGHLDVEDMCKGLDRLDFTAPEPAPAESSQEPPEVNPRRLLLVCRWPLGSGKTKGADPRISPRIPRPSDGRGDRI
jgi:Phage integrase family